jgi:hypothetical protein
MGNESLHPGFPHWLSRHVRFHGKRHGLSLRWLRLPPAVGGFQFVNWVWSNVFQQHPTPSRFSYLLLSSALCYTTLFYTFSIFIILSFSRKYYTLLCLTAAWRTALKRPLLCALDRRSLHTHTLTHNLSLTCLLNYVF